MKLKHNEEYGLWLKWVRSYGLNGWGSYGKVSYFGGGGGGIFSNNGGLQGSIATFSDHRITTGFSPFEIPTCGVLSAF